MHWQLIMITYLRYGVLIGQFDACQTIYLCRQVRIQEITNIFVQFIGETFDGIISFHFKNIPVEGGSRYNVYVQQMCLYVKVMCALFGCVGICVCGLGYMCMCILSGWVGLTLCQCKLMKVCVCMCLFYVCESVCVDISVILSI